MAQSSELPPGRVLLVGPGDSVRAFDQDQIVFSGMPGLIHDYEMNLELNYSAQMIPGWTLQAMLTQVWHPSGGEWPDALVTGIRSIVRF